MTRRPLAQTQKCEHPIKKLRPKGNKDFLVLCENSIVSHITH